MSNKLDNFDLKMLDRMISDLEDYAIKYPSFSREFKKSIYFLNQVIDNSEKE